jgi:hypothetical protein
VDDLLGAEAADPGGEDGESLFGDSPSSGLELRDAPPRGGRPGPGASAEAAAQPARPSAAPARDASPIAMPEDGASGLDLEGDPTPAPPPRPPAIAEAPPTALAEEGDAAPAARRPAEDPVADLASELADELGGDPSADEIPDLDVPAAHPSGPSDTGGEPASDELSSRDWDLLADADPELGSGRSRALKVDPDELIDDRPVWQTAIERSGQGVGWVVVAVLFALGLYGGLLPAPPVSAAPPATSGASGVELRDVSGHFVDHVEAGTVYVVSGRIANTGSRPIAAGTLAVEVLDPAGKRLAPPAQAAAPLSAEAIREGQLSGPWRRSPALRPGESRSFQAVLGPLPAGAQRFNLTTVESSVADTERAPQAPDAGLAGRRAAVPAGSDPAAAAAAAAADVADAGSASAAAEPEASEGPDRRRAAPPAAPSR